MFGNKKRNNAQTEKPLGRYTLKHIAGLPIPSTACSVIVYNERLCFSLGSTDFELSVDKLNAIDFELNVDTERYLKSIIRETAGIEQIKGRLTQMLEEKLAVMAAGVHA